VHLGIHARISVFGSTRGLTIACNVAIVSFLNLCHYKYLTSIQRVLLTKHGLIGTHAGDHQAMND